MSRLSRGYLGVILWFVKNSVAVNHETRARTTTEGKHDPIYDSLPLHGGHSIWKNLKFEQAETASAPRSTYGMTLRRRDS